MSLLLYGAMALSILGAVAGMGYKVHKSGYESCKVEWQQAEAEARKREADLSAFAAKALADERKKRKVVIQERTVYVDRNIEKLVTADSCIKPDGVRTLNDAINGKSADRPKPDGAVPKPAPAG